jgi:fucose permease
VSKAELALSPRNAGRAYLITGFLSLTLVAFLDNARGPILPVICRQLNIPHEIAGWFLTVGCLAAVVTTFLLGRALQRWGERKVTVVSCLLSALPGFYASAVDSRASLLVLGALMGSAVALIGSLCSILTMLGSPPAQRSRYIAFQHVMYGIGSMSAPLLFSAIFRRDGHWWTLIQSASWALLGLALLSYWLLPKTQERASSEKGPQLQMSKGAWLTIAMFAVYVAGEVLASMWMTSLLVHRQAKSPGEAAHYLTAFFVVLAITRFLCFAFLRPQWERKLLFLCLIGASLCGFLGQQGWSWALPAMGILGPFFPIAMSRMSLQFPETWKQMTIYVYAGIQSMLAIMHISVGMLADSLDLSQAFLLSPLFLCLATLLYAKTKER